MDKIFKAVKHIFLFVFFLLISYANGERLPRFSSSPYFDEQVYTFSYSPEVTIQINAPSPSSFDLNKPTEVILFALPNGNNIDETVGKILEPGDDWHYDIQHIGAQTRFLRAHDTTKNIVTVYLQTTQLSWPSWRGKYSNNAALVKGIVDSVKNIFQNYNPFLVLSSHSGGGGFIFSYLANGAVPDVIKRITFLDSDYDYDNTYGNTILNWLNSSTDHFLCVIAYNDSVALYNGQPIVSATGGTWYRSQMMQKYLANYFSFTKEEDSSFIKYTALNGRIKFILKKNPTRAILHTVQVELNGFIEGTFSGTSYEGIDYVYYGSRAYSKWIQKDVPIPQTLNIPPRPSDAISGSAFMEKVKDMSFEDRENEIYNEVSKGNIPDFLRNIIMVKDTVQDAAGVTHIIYYQVIPDYLAIGSNNDYCRIPTGPITAQKLAILFGANLPTRKLVDNIYKNCTLKLQPVTYPWSDASVTIPKFQQHSAAIDSQISAAGGIKGELTGGTKKDVVLSNLITDPSRPNHVCIYGWHQLDGTPIQPLTNIHLNTYDDYSHGIRFINNEVLVDSVIMTVPQILKDPVLYKILSDENGPMSQPGYLTDNSLPIKPSSFGIIDNGSGGLKIIIAPDTSAREYNIYLSKNGVNFNNPFTLSPDNLTINNLQNDSIYYVKVQGINTAGASPVSEVLAGIPSGLSKPKVLIVNGFDRPSDGNTYNFIRQHGSAFLSNGYSFESASNDAVIDGLFSLNNYEVVDYILGDESTADETFSSTEQSIVKNYLDNGGDLFVSGSEIAWDLDYKGSSSDKNFIWNFLKMSYVADAPGGFQSTYYEAEPTTNSLATGVPQFFFDNGTHGTFNVKWPDLVSPVYGGIQFLKYVGVDTSSGVCGVSYAGLFSGGSKPGKVVSIAFPFETIYPETIRNNLIGKILNYFGYVTDIKNENKKDIPDKFTLYQNYPNPFNPSTVIKYTIPTSLNGGPVHVSLNVYDVLGKKVYELVNSEERSGTYKTRFNASGLASGIYIYILQAGDFVQSKKMMFIK